MRNLIVTNFAFAILGAAFIHVGCILLLVPTVLILVNPEESK